MIEPGDYLPTVPASQMIWEGPAWCCGHSWRARRGLGWLHRFGHRARVLRNQPPPRELVMLPRLGGHLSVWGSGHSCASDEAHPDGCVCACGARQGYKLGPPDG